jgi:hypothetical protein
MPMISDSASLWVLVARRRIFHVVQIGLGGFPSPLCPNERAGDSCRSQARGGASVVPGEQDYGGGDRDSAYEHGGPDSGDRGDQAAAERAECF